MNRYEEFLDRKPRRMSYKASLLGAAFLNGYQVGPEHASMRGSTTINGIDQKGNLPA